MVDSEIFIETPRVLISRVTVVSAAENEVMVQGDLKIELQKTSKTVSNFLGMINRFAEDSAKIELLTTFSKRTLKNKDIHVIVYGYNINNTINDEIILASFKLPSLNSYLNDALDEDCHIPVTIRVTKPKATATLEMELDFEKIDGIEIASSGWELDCGKIRMTTCVKV